MSVGSAAATGISAGFQMGREITNDQDRRAQIARENARQDTLDQQRTDQIARVNKRQDVADADTEQDRGLAAVNSEMEDNRIQLAGLAQHYGGVDKIPQSVVTPLITQAQDISQRRTSLLSQKYQPIVQKEQQWAADTSSRIQTGQLSMDDLSPADTVRLIQAQTRRPVTDFLRPVDPKTGAITGNSVIGQAKDDATAGVQTGNGGLTTQGAGVLLAPDINIGVGHVAGDGSIITGKSLAALVPAPALPSPAAAALTPPLVGLNAALGAATAPAAAASPGPAAAPPPAGLGAAATSPAPQPAPDPGVGDPGANDPAAAAANAPPAPPQSPMEALTAPSLQPPAPPPPAPPPPPPLAAGTDPNKVIPVLQVTAEHPDGTQVSYHAPVTMNRTADPSDPVHPGVNISDAMQRMGQLGTLEAWANTPAVRAKITQGIADLGGGINDFTSAYGAMHGDPKALLPAGSTDPTSLKIQAISKLAAASGITFAEAATQLAGHATPTSGIGATLAQVHTQAVADGLSDEAEAAKLQKMGVLRSPPASTAQPPDQSTLTGPALLNSLSPADQATVKGLLDGTIKPETLSVRNNHRENMVSIASRVGGMNTSTAAVNQATEKAFTTGTPSRTIRAMNTAVDHLSTLGQLATALGNGDVNAINSLKNKAASQFGDVDITNFDAAKQIVADEVVKAVVASGGSIGGALADREKAEAQVNNAKSPAQLAGVINTFTKLMGGQINSLGQQYVSGGGTKDFTTFLTPATKSLYRGPQPKGVSGGGGAAGGASKFVNGQVYQDAKGNKATYNNGAWTPVQ